MKSLISKVLLAATLVLGTIGCTKVPAGNVGVKVYLMGGEKGVDHEVVGVGRYWLGINEELYLFPTFEQNPKYKADTDGVDDEAGAALSFQTTEGMEVSGDFSITYRIDKENVSQVFQKYRMGIDEINRGPLRNILRDALNETASKLPVESVYGEGKVEMINQVETIVISRAAESGITVTRVSLLGAFRLPPQVTESLNAKVTATQKAQQRENELREAQAEAQKQVAKANGEAQVILATAKAQAEANLVLSKSLTPELVRYQQLQIQKTAAEKWDGKLPTFNGGGAVPFINVGPDGQPK